MKPLLAMLILAGFGPAIVQAQTADLPPGIAGAEILPGWRLADGSRIAALRLVLDPGWKTYWRVPGEAGIPPVLDFTASRNVADIEVIWPAPMVFDQNGMRSVGYHGDLILPVRITPHDRTEPVTLQAELDFGICRDICVPGAVGMTADLTGAGAPDPRIAAAMAAIPAPRPGAAHCTTEPISDGMRVRATIDLPPAPDEVVMFELASTPMWVSESVMERRADGLHARTDFVPDAAQPFALDPAELRLTVLSAAGAWEIDGCPAR